MCRWEQLVVPGDVSKEEDVKALFERAIETFGKSCDPSSSSSSVDYSTSISYSNADLETLGRLDLLFNVR